MCSHTKGMSCIDCHTREEIMGDGTQYAHYEEQLEISCEGCHSEKPGLTRKNRKLTNVKEGENGFVLTGRNNGKVYPLRPRKTGPAPFPVISG